MPHCRSYVRRGSSFTPNDHLKLAIASSVHWAFKEVAGEDMEIGPQVIPYDPVFANSLPVDVAVVIDCWWTEERSQHLGDLEKNIRKSILWELPRSLSVDVRLVVIGQPANVYRSYEGRQNA